MQRLHLGWRKKMTNSTIRHLIIDVQKRHSGRDAFRYKVKTKDSKGNKVTVVEAKTYDDVKNDSEKMAKAIEKLGEKGKHIAIIGSTSYEWIITYMGVTSSGSVAVPLDALLPEDAICELINRADVTTLVFDETKAKIAKAAQTNCPNLKHVISMKDKSKVENTVSLWSLINEQEPGYDYFPEEDALATIMFTSGTTGKSKGVMLSHRNIVDNATALDMEFKPGEVFMSVLPIHHAYCLTNDLFQTLDAGATVCINDSLLRVAQNIKLFKPNGILMVPLMVETLAKKLEDKKWIPASIVKAKAFGKQFNTIISGGAYLNPEYIKFFKKYKITILQGYGMTENAPIISVNRKSEMKYGSVGKVMPNSEVKIVDEEIWVKGTSVMQGYYKMPEETSEALVDGWLRTGDLGYVDEDGYLFLTGRKKNLIITPNGENVSPEEIENSISNARLVDEILVRDAGGVIEAEIYPDYEYAQKKKITNIQDELQKIIDEYNKTAPMYKRVTRLKVRETEFEKNTTKKIKRF